MGGDAAPQMVVAGAEIAHERLPNVHFLMFGREPDIAPLLEAVPKLASVTTVVHTDDVVPSGERPSIALRSRRQSSMRLALNAVAKGEAIGAVSAGNTGALLAMSKFTLKTLPGVSRPAIASFFPSLGSEVVMLDLGANLQCDVENLVDFAIMGNAFARALLGIQEPRVGLLNVGSEDIKGHEELQEAAAVLRTVEMPGTFLGFVEGDDIGKGNVDVVVTDGFTGNVALKTAEGTANLVYEFVRRTFRSSIFAGLGYLLARPALRKMRHRIDPRRYNGAMFLGLNGIAVKSHGGTDALGFANAIEVAHSLYCQDVISKIEAGMEKLDRSPPKARAATG